MSSDGNVAAGVLLKVPMFGCAPPAQLARLARESRVQHVPRGAVIARRGTPAPGLMVVGYGLVKLSLGTSSEKVLRLVGPGESFGEAMLFLGQPLPVDATALCDSLVVTVPAAPLLALISANPSFARGLLASLCQRLHALVMDFEAATAHGARERLAAYLESLAPPSARAPRVQLPAAKTVIAARLGMAKETLSRLLRQFAAEGLISVERRAISLLDREGLASVARGGKRA